MDEKNKNFIILLSITAMLTAGVIVQNVRSVLHPKSVHIKIDVEKVKRGIDQAGLKPREAMYWKDM